MVFKLAQEYCNKQKNAMHSRCNVETFKTHIRTAGDYARRHSLGRWFTRFPAYNYSWAN